MIQQRFRLISTPQAVTLFPDLSPDNKWVAYACVDNSGEQFRMGIVLVAKH